MNIPHRSVLYPYKIDMISNLSIGFVIKTILGKQLPTVEVAEQAVLFVQEEK